jgi:uracil-DNA glycosylase
MISPDDSFALKDKAECSRREAMLLEPHMQPLFNYLNEMRNALGGDYEMPMFDPCDGGIHARVLILLEAPGPKAIGSQFISRNNPDRTADNINKLLQIAEIARKDTILWNIVPWYIGDSRKIRPAIKEDISLALPFLKKLIELLTNLDFIVLMGKPAQSAILDIRKISNKPIFCAAHPSPKVANIYPEKMLETQYLLNQISSDLKRLAPNNLIVKLTIENIDELLAYLPVFSSTKFKPYTLTKKDNRTFIEYDSVVKAFCDSAYQPCWYSDYDSLVVDEIFRNESLLSNATFEQVKAMLTYFVCGERFSDGFKAQLIESGHLQRLLERLKQLRNTI